MDLGKIQTLRLQQGVVQRLLKRYRLTARQAVSSGKNRSDKVFVVPVVTAELADELRQKISGTGGRPVDARPDQRGLRVGFAVLHALENPVRWPAAVARGRRRIVDPAGSARAGCACYGSRSLRLPRTGAGSVPVTCMTTRKLSGAQGSWAIERLGCCFAKCRGSPSCSRATSVARVLRVCACTWRPAACWCRTLNTVWRNSCATTFSIRSNRASGPGTDYRVATR